MKLQTTNQLTPKKHRRNETVVEMIEMVSNFQVDNTCLSCGLGSPKSFERPWSCHSHVLHVHVVTPFLFGECLTSKIDPSSICRGVSRSGKIRDETFQCKNAVFRNILVMGEIQDGLPGEETTESPNLLGAFSEVSKRSSDVTLIKYQQFSFVQK